MSDPILELERIHGSDGDWRGIFTLGLKSRPQFLTVRSQQERAIALAAAIDACRPAQDRRTRRVLVIGGGFAGLTLASWFAEHSPLARKTGRKWEVAVFEKQNQLVPVQRGCAIRRLHPAIHTWPDSRCFDAPADAPSLTAWRSDAAGQVAAEFVGRLLENHRFAASLKSTVRFAIVQSASISVEKAEGQGRAVYRVTGTGDMVSPSSGALNPCASTWDADVLVFATGYGAEGSNLDEGARGRDIVSYWRNDDLGQAPLYGQMQRYILSGAGDGAITDLFRLCVYDFSYDLLVNELLPVKEARMAERFELAYRQLHPYSRARTPAGDKDDVKDLTSQYSKLIRDIKALGGDSLFSTLEKSWQAGVLTKNRVTGQSLGFLAAAFLKPGLKRHLEVRMQMLPEFARDTSPIQALVDNPRAMLYNRVLAYLLWKLGAFQVVLATTPGEVAAREGWSEDSYTVIVRHGADWRPAVRACLAGELRNEVDLDRTWEPPAAQAAAVGLYRLGWMPA